MKIDADDLKARLSELVADYKKQLPSRIEEIEQAYAALKKESDQREKYVSLRLLVHKLAGSGATFGFDGITEKAKDLESRLDRIINSGLLYSDVAVGEIEMYLAYLCEECAVQDQDTGLEENEKTAKKANANQTDNMRQVIVLCKDMAGESLDLPDQLGYFGFTVHKVSTFSEFKKSANKNPNQVAIVHTNALDKSSQKNLAGLNAKHVDKLHYIFVSETTDFQTRLSALRCGGQAFFELPLDIAKLVDTIDSLNAAEEAEPYHVLIVDDDPDQISYYALLLQQAGMITSVASDPMTVVNILVEAKPELILMDMYMPGCSGTELLSIIRQQETFVGIPVVFLSVEGAADRKLTAVVKGGDDFITKPAEPEYLIASIKNRIIRTRNIRYFMERDSLTGLLNHSNLREQLIREQLRAQRSSSDLCFAMIDLDLFKKVNDTYGHLTGDKVLKSLSRILQERLRRTDVIGRYGGEEFGVILINTSLENAEIIMNEIRENFSHVRHQAINEDFFVTFSCGIANFSGLDNVEQLTNAADIALYEAKEGGRNRVVATSIDVS